MKIVMKISKATQKATQLAAACTLAVWTSASFAQHTGHAHSSAAKATAQADTPASPYAGEQTRDIKSLSASDVTSLLSGAGMAYAKAAELNGYPGPAHVLELSSQLRLNGDQHSATRTLMDQHKSRARTLGAQLLEAERSLDGAFASQQIDAQRVEDLTRQIGTLQARLRAEHLQTHLAQTALLSPQQIASYQRLRGYDRTTTGKEPSSPQ
ncbi:periplasmic heavy metal sensor [Polaromonas sp. JS666]|uniref:periplasmic heavy metal sensor n=1 Tax=Polaromonas sp. (strain JS666 / ATCC BAA-500) TaxID=296591 RepID=UPI0002D74E21|nr:periplasmic heavy metal sensor [Polaromonas sp. JS666]